MTEVQKTSDKKPSSGFNSKNEGKRRYNNRRERSDKVKVTLETEIPELPAKNLRLKEPSEEDFKKSMEKIDNDITELHNKLHKFIEEKRKKLRNEKDNIKEEVTPIRESLKTKIAEKKGIAEDFNKVKVVFDEKKKLFEELYEKSLKYKDKMKNQSTNKEQLESELNHLVDLQKNGNISLAREKDIIKQIAELEKILPYVGPLDALQKQMAVVKKEKAELGKEVNTKWQVLKKYNDEIRDYQDTLNSLRPQQSKEEKVEGDAEKKNQDPEIQAKRTETFDMVKTLKDKKKEIKNNYHDSWDKFEEEKELIRNVEFMTKIKTRLVKEDEYNKLKEKERLAYEEELKQMTGSPYQDEMNLCDLLIEYLTKLKPRQSEQKQSEANNVDLSEALKSKEWKKENCTVMKPTKETNDDFMVGTKLSKKDKQKLKQQKNKSTQEAEQKESTINHNVDVLGYFDSLKVPAPTFNKNIDDTVKQLQEKKQYFKDLPEDSNVKTTSTTRTQGSPVKESSSKRRAQNLEVNEEDFPEM